MRIYPMLLACVLTLLVVACKNKPHVKEFYIISLNDSTDFSNKSEGHEKSKDKHYVPEVKGGLYTQLVILLDSSDYVYLYQTEIIKASVFHYYIDDKEDYQDFIKLRPEHLIKFDSKNFINFITDNNDIFHFDSTSKFTRCVFIASNKDTVKNVALYDFAKMVKSQKRNKWDLLYAVRRTTEEETRVMYCKRNHMIYDPLKYTWSKNSLISKYNPGSKQYDSAENKRYDLIYRPRMTYFVDTVHLLD